MRVLIDGFSVVIVFIFAAAGVYVTHGGHIPGHNTVFIFGICGVFLAVAAIVWLFVRGQKIRPVARFCQWLSPSYVGSRKAMFHRFFSVAVGIVVWVILRAMLQHFS
jgi:hypothetical protein